MGDNNNIPNNEKDLETTNNSYTNDEAMNQDSANQQYSETTFLEPTKKKPSGKFIAIAIVLVVLLVGAVAAYANRNVMANMLSLMTKKPAEYYAYIEKKNMNDDIDKFTDSYGKAVKKYNKQLNEGASQDINLKFSINDTFANMMQLGDLGSIQANIVSMAKNGNSKSTLGLSYNDNSLISMNTFMNADTSELLVNIPELSSAYLMFSLNELMTITGEMPNSYNYQEYMNETLNLLNSESLSSDNLNTLLKKYSNLVIDKITTITLDKNVSVTASDITSKFTKLTAEISNEDMYNIAVAVLTEAKNDEVLKNLCTSLELTTAEEYPQLIQSQIDELAATKDSLVNSEEKFYMNVYVDNTGNIMGREFSASANEKAIFGYNVTKKGSKFGLSAWVAEDDVNLLEVTGDASYKNNAFTGTATLSFSDYDEVYGDYTTYSFDVDFDKASMNDKTGYVNGKYTISSDLLMGMKFVFDFKASDKQQDMVFNLEFTGMDAATLEMTYKEGVYEDYAYPDSTTETYDGLTEMESYLATIDIDNFITNLENALGIEDLEGLINQLIYSSMY